MISIVAAVAKNGVIGANGTIPWRSKEDMRFFRELTTGHAVIMGRKTFESIGKPLPNRRNIVVTSTLPHVENVVRARSLLDAIETAYETDSKVFVIGGESIYRAALSVAVRIYLTRVAVEPEGDVMFPDLASGHWLEEEDQARDLHDVEPRLRFTSYVCSSLVLTPARFR